MFEIQQIASIYCYFKVGLRPAFINRPDRVNINHLLYEANAECYFLKRDQIILLN